MAALLKDASTRRLLISKSFKFFAPFELKQEFEKYREELLKNGPTLRTFGRKIAQLEGCI
jgi:hypothetical protein